ncbi:hypothetical protein [Aphanizomenon sp. UHCC 0183]|uniref:hypothetical protein n=1 Tax=Aphanizomenon sp. UHCC 0183 TaxID=2590028 RepID=UPI001447FC87|nr:hypothetical protein [Aphanizomenon sp. UHCC 0183]MTJ29091.1 hypothetical protein [Aphanizomenon sp. UHCC 0183]
MERVKLIGLLVSSLGWLGLAWLAISPASGEYPELFYSIYPAPGTYSVKAEATGFCGSSCVALQFREKIIWVDSPKRIVKKPGTGVATLAVDGYNRPTLISWEQ